MMEKTNPYEKYSYILLLLILFVLPNFEAPKNIFFPLFVIVSVIYIYKDKKYNIGLYDISLVLWVASAILVSLHAYIVYQGAGDGWVDILRFTLFGFLLSYLTLNEEKIRLIVWVITLGTFLGIIVGIYHLLSSEKQTFELHSVGHINHTAIYLVLVLSLLLSYLVFSLVKVKEKLFLGLAVAIVFAAIVYTGSRAALGVSLVVFFLSALVFAVKQKYSLVKFLGGLSILLVIITLWVPTTSAYKRHMSHTKAYSSQLTPRERINNVSWEIFKAYPLLGIGHDNYQSYAKDGFADVLMQNGQTDDPALYLAHAHAHHFFYTYLVAGGIVGFIGMMFFWLTLLYYLLKRAITVYRNRTAPVESALWVATGFVVLINLAIGLVNTTMHHEHAILSITIIGLFIAYQRSQGIQSKS